MTDSTWSGVVDCPLPSVAPENDVTLVPVETGLARRELRQVETWEG
jgi:hypothetical protein